MEHTALSYLCADNLLLLTLVCCPGISGYSAGKHLAEQWHIKAEISFRCSSVFLQNTRKFPEQCAQTEEDSMKTVGIIAEYNPFHTGHAHHLKTARQKSGADYVIVVMSPDFVQRGEPAVFDKFTRTRMALQNGADLVLELPVCYACGSAEYFARGAVTLLEKLKAVDTLCFGCETADTSLLQSTAALLFQEPEPYRGILKDGVRRGLTYPQARTEALRQCQKYDHTDLPSSWDEFFSSPNNILAIEYCKALIRLSSSMEVLPVIREGNGYHSSALEGSFCSATAIRKAIAARDSLPLSYIPEICREDFEQACRYTLSSQDLLPLLTEKLLTTPDFSRILDISPDLSDRMDNLRFSCIGKSWEEITDIIKTRQITKARIRRGMLHLILNLTDEAMNRFLSDGTVSYARILGFCRDAAPLLHHLKQSSTLPLITKTASAASLLDETGKEMLRLDFTASHLYRSIRSLKYELPFRTEYEHSPVIL